MEGMKLIYHYFPAPILALFLCICIVTICQYGDYLLRSLRHSDESMNRLIRALADSCTHTLIGGFTWAFVENSALLSSPKVWLKCIFCAMLAGAVDLDHFLAAGALDLKKALSLNERPMFHNSSLIIVIIVICEILHYFTSTTRLLSLMITCSWLSHHLRDAQRRGLWFYPLGSTPPLPSVSYVLLTIMLAVILRVIFVHLNLSQIEYKARGNLNNVF